MKLDKMYSDDMQSMCNGVFEPVCSPEVCNVPKIPYYQDLVIGKGKIMECNCFENNMEIIFRLHIYRELMDVFGKLELMGPTGTSLMYSDRLEAYHAPTEDYIIAVFHYVYGNNKSREVVVFAKASQKRSNGKLYIYSAPIGADEINIGGKVINGSIEIEVSDVKHNAH